MQREADLFHSRPNPTPGQIVPTPVGSMNYNVLRALLEEGNIIKLQRGAEIGVLQASTSVHLLKSFPDLKLYCVDPFCDYSKDEPERTQESMSQHEITARSRLQVFGERAEIIKNFSVEASKQIPDHSLDFVFIDAIHSYEAVKADLEAWYPKVRHDGLIAGHDFSWSGVKEAVQGFIQPISKPGFHTPSTSDVWFFVK
jgi:predicted O-methyltransferase YrrM